MFPVEVRIRAHWREGHLLAVSLDRDITERKRTEEALRRSEAYLAEAQRLSHTGTLVFNAAPLSIGRRKVTGSGGLIRCRASRTGKPSCNGFTQTIARECMNDRRGLAQKRRFTHEFRIVLPDGVVRYIESTGHPLLSRMESFWRLSPRTSM